MLPCLSAASKNPQPLDGLRGVCSTTELQPPPILMLIVITPIVFFWKVRAVEEILKQTEEDADKEANHEEVMETANLKQKELRAFVAKMVHGMAKRSTQNGNGIQIKTE